MDEQKKPQTINEEAGLPENWVPIDTPPIVPGRMEPAQSDGSQKFLQASLPPGYQHDTSFVGTEYRAVQSPNLSLMPLGISGNPTSNAAVQSTAALVAPSAVAASVSVELRIPNIFTPVDQTVNLPGLLQFTLANEPPDTAFLGPTGAPGGVGWIDAFGGKNDGAASLTFSATTTQANDFGLFIGQQSTTASSNMPVPTGWTAASPWGVATTGFINGVTAGTQTMSVSYSDPSSTPTSAAMAAFIPYAGAAPSATANIVSGSVGSGMGWNAGGGAAVVPTGTTMLFALITAAWGTTGTTDPSTGLANNTTVSDNQGNTWYWIGTQNYQGQAGAGPVYTWYGTMAAMYFCPNPVIASTYTFNFLLTNNKRGISYCVVGFTGDFLQVTGIPTFKKITSNYLDDGINALNGNVLTADGRGGIYWAPATANLFYQTVQSQFANEAQQTYLNFLAPMSVVNDITHSSTNISVPVFQEGATHFAGLVPDPGATPGTTKFLREDATWAVPSGGGGGSNFWQLRKNITMAAISTGVSGVGDEVTVFSAASGFGANNPVSGRGYAYEYSSTFGASSAFAVGGHKVFRVGQNANLLAFVYFTAVADLIGYIYLTTNSANNGASHASDPAGNGDSVAGFLFRNLNGGGPDTKWQAITSDGVTNNIQSTGITPNTSEHTFAIVMNDGTPNVTFYIDGTLVATSTTNLPASGTNLAVMIGSEYQTTSNRFGVSEYIGNTDL